MKTRWKTFPLFLFLVLWVAACGPKVIPKEFEEKIDKKLTFEEIQKNPDAYRGRSILIGGEIIETRNLKDKTEIEVLQKPLGSNRAPVPIDESNGRFILIHSSFLDPAVFRSGRRLTAVGTVQGGRDERFGEAERITPVLEDEHIHLWPPGQADREPSVGFSFGIGAVFGR
ncbi:MAG: Slp family lipoprotein [Nitrospirae bacterium]|nr:Slp family lipoprotein [Candidatus Manganitrophaceae bacterium]